MQNIKLPDGTMLQFPDGMSDDEMAAAISENFPEFAGTKDAAAAPAEKHAAAPAPAAAAPASSGGGILDGISNWYDHTKQAILSNKPISPEQAGIVEPEAAPAINPDAARKYGVMAGVTADDAKAALANARAPQAPAPDPLGLHTNDDRDPVAVMRRTNELYQRTATSDMLDPSAEARARQLVRNGTRGDLANAEARVAAEQHVMPGMEPSLRGGKAQATDFDFDAYRKFNNDPFWSNPAVRGAVKGYEGYKQGILGINQAVGEAFGADVSGQAGLAKESRGLTDAMGESSDYLQRNFEGTISSISQQLPALIGGAVTGSESLVLGSMFAQTFGQEYSDTRAKGQDQGAALTRAGLYGAFEVIGEKFGLGERLKLLKNSAAGVETNVLAKWMAQTLTHELPGELLTTTGQFAVDKLPGIGQDQEAGWEKYLQQMGDTVTQTIMQGGIMSVSTGGVNHARAYMNGEFDRGAESDANAAQRDALNKWNTSGLTPSSRSSGNGGRVEPSWREAGAIATPGGRVEPSLADIGSATNVDDAIAAAAAFTAQPVTAPNMPTPPASTSAYPTAAEIDALEQQAGIVADHTPDEHQAAHDHLMTEMQARALENAGQHLGAAPAADLPPGGKTADVDDWHAFPPESRTLGVPRAQMPQIRAEHRGALTQFLAARGIPHQEIEVAPDSLKPTQREFSVSKVQKAVDYQGGNRAILVSNDGYVLDGHHQWMAAMEKGEPIRAIRFDAPIKQLVKTVHEFPSATVDTASAAAAPAPADPTRQLTPYEQSQERNRRQAEIVQQAADRQAQHRAGQAPQEPGSSVPTAAERAPMAPPKPTAGQRMRERIHRENPFLGFLATHGLHIDERSDTGGQKGRAGGVIVPGFGGSLYRKNGARLDELAQLAHEAGFLSDDDINDPTDNGGTRKLADMIERAVYSKQVIDAPGLIDSAMPTADQQLFEEAERLGIDTAGKTADQLYDEVRAAHAGEQHHRENVTGASSAEEQEQITHYADQITPEELADAQLLDDDLMFDFDDPRIIRGDDLTDEELDAIFKPQEGRGPQVHSLEIKSHAGTPAPQGAARTGAPSKGEIRERLKVIALRLGIQVKETTGAFTGARGMVFIPPEDHEAEGAQTPEHVFAHELGHAIMHKREVSFKGFPIKEVRRYVSNWDELVAASKAYRPAIWNHEKPKIRDHARKPNEIMADAIGSVLLGEQPLSMLEPFMTKLGITEHDMGLRERGQVDDDNLLTSYTAGDVLEREDAATAKAKAIQAERDKLEARRKAEQDAKETKARVDAGVDDFQLGQSAESAVFGQDSLFDQQAAASDADIDRAAKAGYEAGKAGKMAPPFNLDGAELDAWRIGNRRAMDEATGTKADGKAALPKVMVNGSMQINSTPLNSRVWHETSPENAARLFEKDNDSPVSGYYTNSLYVTDNADLALGQKGNKGVRLEFDGKAVSGIEHEKPGTGFAGREYVTNGFAPHSIVAIKVAPGKEFTPRIFRKELARDFIKTVQPDGGVLYVRRGFETSAPAEGEAKQGPSTWKRPDIDKLSDYDLSRLYDRAGFSDGESRPKMQRKKLNAAADEKLQRAQERLDAEASHRSSIENAGKKYGLFPLNFPGLHGASLALRDDTNAPFAQVTEMNGSSYTVRFRQMVANNGNFGDLTSYSTLDAALKEAADVLRETEDTSLSEQQYLERMRERHRADRARFQAAKDERMAPNALQQEIEKARKGDKRAAPEVAAQVPAAEPVEEAAPPVDTGADIPANFYSTVTVDYAAPAAEAAEQLGADKALERTREDIANIEALLKCMGKLH